MKVAVLADLITLERFEVLVFGALFVVDSGVGVCAASGFLSLFVFAGAALFARFAVEFVFVVVVESPQAEIRKAERIAAINK